MARKLATLPLHPDHCGHRSPDGARCLGISHHRDGLHVAFLGSRKWPILDQTAPTEVLRYVWNATDRSMDPTVIGTFPYRLAVRIARRLAAQTPPVYTTWDLRCYARQRYYMAIPIAPPHRSPPGAVSFDGPIIYEASIGDQIRAGYTPAV